MRNRNTLLTTYIVEMYKLCNEKGVKKGGLRNVKVDVELAYHNPDGSTVNKHITGYTQSIVAGLKMLDKHQKEGVMYTVEMVKINLEKY